MLSNRSVAVIALAATLGGCSVGTNFVRPDATSLQNGQTTYAEVVQRLGRPFNETPIVKNDKTLKVLFYGYGTGRAGGPLHIEVKPFRTMNLTFFNDILVGHVFVSSFAADHTDFDESKRSQIISGKTTRAEVLRLFGKPAGYLVYPAISTPTHEAAVYQFEEYREGLVSGVQIYRKSLQVEFDSVGIVTHLEFSSTGEVKNPGSML